MWSPRRVTHKIYPLCGIFYFPWHRPLSRRLDRCDRVIHNESGDPNGGNMCSFSGATCTSRDVTMQITFLTRKSALIYRRDLRQRVASLTLNCNGVLAIRAYRHQIEGTKGFYCLIRNERQSQRDSQSLMWRARFLHLE